MKDVAIPLWVLFLLAFIGYAMGILVGVGISASSQPEQGSIQVVVPADVMEGGVDDLSVEALSELQTAITEELTRRANENE